jgi:hypothetical protein
MLMRVSLAALARHAKSPYTRPHAKVFAQICNAQLVPHDPRDDLGRANSRD